MIHLKIILEKNLKQMFINLQNFNINDDKEQYLLGKYKLLRNDVNMYVNIDVDLNILKNLTKILINYKEINYNNTKTFNDIFINHFNKHINELIKNIIIENIDNTNYHLNKLKLSNLSNIFDDYNNELLKILNLFSKFIELNIINCRNVINYIENYINLVHNYIQTKKFVDSL